MLTQRIKVGDRTPWGKAQHVEQLCPNLDVYKVSTAGHGGYRVFQTAWNKCTLPKNVVAELKKYSDNGWYEEDCAWCAVAFAFPLYFSDFSMKCAGETCQRTFPKLAKFLLDNHAIGEY